MGIAVLLKSAP